MTHPTTTWSLSGFGDEIDADPDVQLDVLAEIGASQIEVRSAWGVNVADFDDARTAQLRAVLDRRGFTASAVASPIGKVDVTLPVEHEVQRLQRVIRVADGLGTPCIRIFSFYRDGALSHAEVRDAVLERMRALADTAAAAGVVLLHENEKGIYGDTPDHVLDLVESVGSGALRLAWDNANFVQVGSTPFTDGWHLLHEYVDYLQVKDARAGSGEVVPAGEGDGELLETLTALRDAGYSGVASLEPHLASAHELGGFSGPDAFRTAAAAFRTLTDRIGVTLA